MPFCDSLPEFRIRQGKDLVHWPAIAAYVALEENFGRFVGIAEADNFRTIEKVANHPLGRIVIGGRHEVIKVRALDYLSVLDPGKQMRPLVVDVSSDPGIVY